MASRKLNKTQGMFSSEPKEQARQTQELERSVQQTFDASDTDISDLEDRIAALEQYNIDNP